MFISRSFTSSSVHKDFDSLVTLGCCNYLINIISQLNSTQASLLCNQLVYQIRFVSISNTYSIYISVVKHRTCRSKSKIYTTISRNVSNLKLQSSCKTGKVILILTKISWPLSVLYEVVITVQEVITAQINSEYSL